MWELYRDLHPVDGSVDAAGDAETTRSALAAELSVENAYLELPIFPAATVLGQEIDRLLPTPHGYDVVLVRPVTRLRGVLGTEGALALRALEALGTTANSFTAVYANRNYVRTEGLDAEALLRESDITRRVRGHLSEFDRWIARLSDLAPAEAVPEGYRCGDPHCALCYGEKRRLPITHVRHLLHGRDTARELMDRGITHVRDLPADIDLTRGQIRQLEALRSGRPYVDAERMRGFVDSLEYPLGFLDFEALSRVVPPRPGVRVGQHVPFLYSLHVAERRDAPLGHHWGQEGDRNPREFAEKLLTDLHAARGVVAFGAAFERKMLAFLADRVPEYAEDLETVAESIVDVALPFQRVWVHHPDQRGSLSLKQVAAAFAGIGYEDLEVQDGGEANYHYASAQDGDGVSAELMRQLVDYCARDTHALAELVFALERLVAQTG
jgi:hypothetical protein